MKILMFGRGVIAALHGWALERAGHSVEFYVRPGRAAQYGPALPLKIFDVWSPFKRVSVEETWTIRLREELPVEHDYDLILVSVQHYQFAEVAAFLGPRAGKATILLFNNLWTDPLVAAAPLPADQVVWGFPVAGGGFDEHGTLRGLLFRRVQLGTFGTALTQRGRAVRELFQKSGFGVQEHTDFRGWLWIHFAVNAGLHAQALQAGSLQGLMNSTDALKNVLLNVRELLPVVAARGVDLGAHATEVAPFRFPPALVGLALKTLLKFSASVRLILESHTNPEELRRTCQDMLEEARRLGISVPRLEAAEKFFAR